MARYLLVKANRKPTKKNGFNWSCVDTKRKTGNSPNVLYAGHSYDTKGSAHSAAISHNKNLKKPLPIKIK